MLFFELWGGFAVGSSGLLFLELNWVVWGRLLGHQGCYELNWVVWGRESQFCRKLHGTKSRQSAAFTASQRCTFRGRGLVRSGASSWRSGSPSRCYFGWRRHGGVDQKPTSHGMTIAGNHGKYFYMSHQVSWEPSQPPCLLK